MGETSVGQELQALGAASCWSVAQLRAFGDPVLEWLSEDQQKWLIMVIYGDLWWFMVINGD